MRVGKFGFLNNFLPYYWLEKQNVEVVEAPPKKLAEMLENGEIDFAPVPSFYFLKNKERLKNYDFCVASEGRVLSVIVISKKKTLDDGCIAVTNETMTSVNLLRLILKERGMKNRIVLMDKNNACDLLKYCDHALVIGDEAIKARMQNRVVMDLGEEWYELTGYPMVFGVSASLKNRDASEINRRLMESVEWGLNNMNIIVDEAKKKFNLPSEFLEEYFRCLNYRLGSKEKRGLEIFEEMCRENGLL